MSFPLTLEAPAALAHLALAVQAGTADGATICLAQQLLSDCENDLLLMVAGAYPETVNELRHTSLGRAALAEVLEGGDDGCHAAAAPQ